MNWFQNCTTVSETKKLYRELALKHHPDRPGGDTETMQQINAAYHKALQHLDGQTEIGDSGKEYTYRYRESVEQAVIDMIAKTIRSGVLDRGVELWLIGKWLWCIGNTKPNRNTLRDLGYRYHGKRQAWYWHEGRWYRKASDGSLADIAHKYGAHRIAERERDEEQKKLAAA